MIPKFKVTIDGTDYENDVFISLNVKDRECNYSVATLVASDPTQELYGGDIEKFDAVEVSLKATSTDAYTKVFGGKVRQINPVVSSTGKLLTVNCKGYGAALEDTHCNRDYGVESSNTAYTQPAGIVANILEDFVAKSFDGAATGHTLDSSLISAYCMTDIKYINNPYRANIEIIDTICNLTSAIGAGAVAGAHWIVDPDGYFLLGKIGDHAAGLFSPEARWADWWNTNQAGSTLTEGVDFTEFSILDKAEEYANHVVLVTDFRRPAFDYWTEGGVAAGCWDYNGVSIADTDIAPGHVVGSNYFVMEDACAWTPAAADAGWDITAWGSVKTIPKLNFYMNKYNIATTSQIRLFTTNYGTDYFYCNFTKWSDADATWVHKSINIGPYWANNEDSREFRWTASSANADWTNINGLAFYALGVGENPGVLCLDDLHFSGKIVRSAKNAAAIAANTEAQKVLIARNAMDDSCVASDDTGFAARFAYAELLRRLALPQTISFTVMGKPTMMAGQKLHVHACKQPAGTFIIDADMRALVVEHNFSTQGFITTVTATSDLMNSYPINQPDQYGMWMENMFLNSNEAKNIRAGGEVDLLIPMLSKSY
jgi:hypothetical protein